MPPHSQNPPRIKALPSPILSAFLSYHPSTHSLHELAKNSDARGVQALLLHGANPDQPHPELMFTPLIAAVYNKDLASAEVLLRGLSGEARPEDESLLLWMKNTGKREPRERRGGASERKKKEQLSSERARKEKEQHLFLAPGRIRSSIF